MSEIGVLSNQYDQLVSTSDKVNDSVIVFKKHSLLKDKKNSEKYPKLSVSIEEFKRAKDLLIPFLTNIKNLVSEEALESEFIPILVLEDYKKKLLSHPYIDEDITDLISKMQKDANIDIDDISVLDEILTVLDTERSMLFRKLRTARG
jgi:hypothetical protein